MVLGGYTRGEVVPGERVRGMYDVVLMALDPQDLSTTWAHQLGTPGADWLTTLTVHGETLYWGASFGDPDGYPFAPEIGVLAAWSLDGSERWRTHLGPGNAPIGDLVVTSEGLVLSGQVYAGQLGTEVAGFGNDTYLQGRSFTGEELWTEVYGTSDVDGFRGIATEGDDRLYAVGYTGGRMFGEAQGSPWDAVLVALDVPHVQRPDLSLRVARGGEFVGDNRYGVKRRPVRFNVRRGGQRDLVVRIEDDGLLADRQVLRSCSGAGGGGLRLTFRDGRRDVTRSTSKGNFRTRMLRPGGAHRLGIHVDAARARPGTYSCSLVSRSGARRHEADRLDLRIVVKPRS